MNISRKKSALVLSLCALCLSSCSKINVSNPSQLSSLQTQTYVIAVIVALVAFAISILVAQLIAFQPGNDRSYIARRIWSIVICLVSAASFYMYNLIVVSSHITKVPLKSQFMMTNLYSTLIIIALYAIIGFVVALVFRKSKFATIFFKSANK